jgi:hypothetical protein
MSSTSLFEYSTAFRNVSAETKKLCEDGGSNRLKRRDPAMYGDHHICKCGEPAKYIVKDAHWCKYCLDTEEYPHLAGKSQEERIAIKAEGMAKIGGAKLVSGFGK